MHDVSWVSLWYLCCKIRNWFIVKYLCRTLKFALAYLTIIQEYKLLPPSLKISIFCLVQVVNVSILCIDIQFCICRVNIDFSYSKTLRGINWEFIWKKTVSSKLKKRFIFRDNFFVKLVLIFRDRGLSFQSCLLSFLLWINITYTNAIKFWIEEVALSFYFHCVSTVMESLIFLLRCVSFALFPHNQNLISRSCFELLFVVYL